MKIYYVTGNDLKVKLANQIFNKMGVEIVQEKIDLPEIQSLDCEEVSKYSAKFACEKLNKPVIKNDSGICFDGLNGFPGALSKFCENTIGAEGYIKLLEGKSRNCHWIEVISYCEPNKEPISFTSITKGIVANEVREGRGYDFDKIFIPINETRTFSQMTEEEQLSFFNSDAYLKLYEYLNKEQH